MVEVERGKSTALITSCNTEIADGMVIRTDSEKVLKTRKMVLELILSDHPRDCMTCGNVVPVACKTLLTSMA